MNGLMAGVEPVVSTLRQHRNGLPEVWRSVLELNSQVNTDGLLSALWMQREDSECDFTRDLLELALEGAVAGELRDKAREEIQQSSDQVVPTIRFWSAFSRWCLLFSALLTANVLLEIDAVHIWNPLESVSLFLLPPFMMLCGLAVLLMTRVFRRQSRRSKAYSMFAEGLIAIVEPDSAPEMRILLDRAGPAGFLQRGIPAPGAPLASLASLAHVRL